MITGNDAIDLLKFMIDDQNEGNIIKLIIIDYYMDYMNGNEALLILKQLLINKKIKKIPYIACITADTDSNTVNYLCEVGFDKVLDKNISYSVANALIDSIENS